jgi:hypothetical protein
VAKISTSDDKKWLTLYYYGPKIIYALALLQTLGGGALTVIGEMKVTVSVWTFCDLYLTK